MNRDDKFWIVMGGMTLLMAGMLFMGRARAADCPCECRAAVQTAGPLVAQKGKVVCTCPCAVGGPCTCGDDCPCCRCVALAYHPPEPGQANRVHAAPSWHADPGGTADLGLWEGDVFLGRWVAARRCYLPWTGTAYGPACPIPAGAPVSTPVVVYRPPVVMAPPVMFGGFRGSFGGGCSGGGCSGGRCR